MRSELTLPPPPHQRQYIYGGITILCFAGIAGVVWGARQNIPLLIFALLVTVIAVPRCLNKAWLLLQQRYLRQPMEYDEHHLYLRQKDGSETTILFKDISEINYDFFTGNSFRSMVNVIIHYQVDFSKGRVELTVFKKNRPQYKQFTQYVQTDNPSLSIDSWA